MKKVLIGGLCLFLPMITLAYTPTLEDRAFVVAAEETFSSLFPEHVAQLVRVYDALDTKKVAMRVAAGERGVYIWEELKDSLHEQLFRQSEVCTTMHAQFGDTVELQYQIHNTAGELVRGTTKPLVFNPGKGQVWTSLEQSVLGMQVGKVLRTSIKTTGVIPKEDGTEQKTVHRDTIDLAVPLVVGKEYAFGVHDEDRVVLGTITNIEDDRVTFDFVASNNDDKVYITVSLDRLRKACN